MIDQKRSRNATPFPFQPCNPLKKNPSKSFLEGFIHVNNIDDRKDT